VKSRNPASRRPATIAYPSLPHRFFAVAVTDAARSALKPMLATFKKG
jgi:hypothetical protein